MSSQWRIIGGVGNPVAGPSGDTTAPGDVLGITVTGVINPVTNGMILTVTVTPPSPLGTFAGCHLYLEIPDQSAGDAFTVGTSPLDGSASLAGAWAPVDLGSYTYSGGAWTVSAPAPFSIDASVDVPCRIYAVSRSTIVENKLKRATDGSPTPNQTFTLTSLTSGTPNAGTNVTGLIGGDGVIIGIVATPLSPDSSTGKLVTPVYVLVTDTPPTAGWQARLVLTFGSTDPTIKENQMIVGGIITQAGPVSGPADGISAVHAFALDTPKVITTATLWLQAGLVDGNGVAQWNNIVPGITPSWQFSYGSTIGTLDASAVLTASIAASMAVVNGLFGVAPAGITNSLLGSGAVATINIQALAVTNPLLASLAVAANNLQALSITTGNNALDTSVVTSTKIAAAAVGTAAIANAAITNALIANLAVSAAQIISATITTTQIASATIAGANIATATIATANIANLAVTTALIANLAVTDAKINDLSANKITAGTISATISITSPTITITGTGPYTGTTITIGPSSAILAADSLTSTTIQAGVVTLAKNSTHESLVMTQGGVTLDTSFGTDYRMDLTVTGMQLRKFGTGIGIKALLSIDPSTFDGYLQFNNGSNYALWAGANGKKVVCGVVQLSGGQATVTHGLTSVEAVTLGLASGGTPTEYLGTSGYTSTFTIYSSNVTSTTFVAWMAFGPH